MAAKSLQELFVEELRDMYDGERRLTKALPRMAKAADSEELGAAFTNHLRETEKQVQRLEHVFRTLGEPVRGKTCDGIMGIVEEGKHAMDELHGSVLDAALIAGAQKVEHYEIASYGTLAYFAEVLGQDQAKELLGQTLEEEKAADETLSTIAKSSVNRAALMAAGNEDEQQPIARSSRGSGARRMASKGSRVNSSRAMASDRSRGGVRGNAGGRRRSRSTRSR